MATRRHGFRHVTPFLVALALVGGFALGRITVAHVSAAVPGQASTPAAPVADFRVPTPPSIPASPR